MLSTGVIVTLGVGCINALDLFFVKTNMHAKATLYGLIEGAFGGNVQFVWLENFEALFSDPKFVAFLDKQAPLTKVAA